MKCKINNNNLYCRGKKCNIYIYGYIIKNTIHFI